MRKKTLHALENVFAAEIEGRLPFCSKAQIYKVLEQDGLLDPMERKFGSGILAVVVTGFQLSHAGRIAYCSSCLKHQEGPPMGKLTDRQRQCLEWLYKQSWEAIWWGGKPHCGWPKQITAATYNSLSLRGMISTSTAAADGFNKIVSITAAGKHAIS